MTESKNWGGSRSGAGRKPKAEHEKVKTAVIRVPENLLQTIEQLKQGKTVTNNQDITELKAALENEKLLHESCVRTGVTLRNEISKNYKLYEEYLKKYNKLNKEQLPELKQENKELVKRNDWLDQQKQSLESKLKDSERDNLRLKTELEKANKKYQDLINLPVSEFAKFQENYFIQYGKQTD